MSWPEPCKEPPTKRGFDGLSGPPGRASDRPQAHALQPVRDSLPFTVNARLCGVVHAYDADLKHRPRYETYQFYFPDRPPFFPPIKIELSVNQFRLLRERLRFYCRPM